MLEVLESIGEGILLGSAVPVLVISLARFLWKTRRL
jgi:hypothetical protein